MVNRGKQRGGRGECTKVLTSSPNTFVFSNRCLENYHSSFNKRRTWLSVNLIIIVKLCGDAGREERKEGSVISWRRDHMILGQDRKSGKTWMDFRM